MRAICAGHAWVEAKARERDLGAAPAEANRVAPPHVDRTGRLRNRDSARERLRRYRVGEEAAREERGAAPLSSATARQLDIAPCRPCNWQRGKVRGQEPTRPLKVEGA